jgi:hypothetical protein
MIFICETLFLSETKLDESDPAEVLWPFNTQTSTYSVFSAANRELISECRFQPIPSKFGLSDGTLQDDIGCEPEDDVKREGWRLLEQCGIDRLEGRGSVPIVV